MMNLDLVITVDTAVAHLGRPRWRRPCWVLLPDYQKIGGASRSRRFALGIRVMRLFRQRWPGDWTTTIGRRQSRLDGLAWLAGGITRPP